MTLNKVFFTVLCCSLHIAAQDGETAQPTPNSSRSSTPETVVHSVLDTVLTPLTKTLSIPNLFTQGEIPTKEHRTHEDLDMLLGGDCSNRLPANASPEEVQDFLLGHPVIFTAIAAANNAYLCKNLDKENPYMPNKPTVRQFIQASQFTVEDLKDGLIVLTRTTENNTKQAWFAIAGTDSISRAITNIGIGTHMHAFDYHNFMTSLWSDHIAPKLYSENSYCASAFNYMSSLPLNLYHMAHMAYLTLSMYGFSKMNHTTDLYKTYFGMLCSTGFIISAVLYSNMVPHALYNLRYKSHTTRLLARIRQRRKELEEDGYTDFSITGHSSGGHHAQIIGLLMGIRSFSFNSPGGTFQHAQWVYRNLKNRTDLKEPTKERYLDSVLDIKTEGDFVCRLEHMHDLAHPLIFQARGRTGFFKSHQALPMFWECQQHQN